MDEDLLNAMIMPELRKIAKDNGWRGYSQLRKSELIQFILERLPETQPPVPVQRPPVPVQRPPVPVQRPPVPVQRSPVPVQRSPVPVQRPPVPVQRPKSPIAQRPKSPIAQRPKSPIAQRPKSPIDDCCVCSEADTKGKLKCGHVVCKECIDQMRGFKCPLCRKQMEGGHITQKTLSGILERQTQDLIERIRGMRGT